MILPEGTPGIAFGMASDGDPRREATARAAISAELGISSDWAWARQVHGAGVLMPEAPGTGEEADALVTTAATLPVAVSIADCFPIALVGAGQVGIAHAGWRGAAQGVVARLSEAMASAGHPAEAAVIGPGIGPCCFEVGDEVARLFPGHVRSTTWGTTSVDLPGAIREQIPGVQVEDTALCTHHDDRFHSFRRTGTSRRQFGVAWVVPA